VLLFGVGHQLKLCDFGTATKIEHTLTNGVGTVRYMAPEVIKGMYIHTMILESSHQIPQNECIIRVVECSVDANCI